MDSLQKEKIRLRNEYHNRINAIKKNISRIEESNHNLVRSGLSKDFVDKSKEKNKEKLIEFENELNEIEEQLRLLDGSTLDSEIEERLRKNNVKNEENLKKENEKVKQKQIEQEYKSKAFERTRNYDRENNAQYRSKEYEMDREYSYFLRAVDRCPDYIQKNLKEMPNNKGYIFNGVTFLGKLPREQGQPDVYFEKLKEGVMIIHEYSPDWTKIVKKYPDGRREILKDEPRVRIAPQFNNNIVFNDDFKKAEIEEKKIKDEEIAKHQNNDKKHYDNRGQHRKNYDNHGQQKRNYDNQNVRNNEGQPKRNYDGQKNNDNQGQPKRNYDGQKNNDNQGQPKRNYDNRNGRNNEGQPKRNYDGQNGRKNEGQPKRNYDNPKK